MNRVGRRGNRKFTFKFLPVRSTPQSPLPTSTERWLGCRIFGKKSESQRSSDFKEPMTSISTLKWVLYFVLEITVCRNCIGDETSLTSKTSPFFKMTWMTANSHWQVIYMFLFFCRVYWIWWLQRKQSWKRELWKTLKSVARKWIFCALSSSCPPLRYS